MEGSTAAAASSCGVLGCNSDSGQPGVGPHDQRDFAFSPNQLFQLLNQRKASDLRAIGDLTGLCDGLRTDPTTGISADETDLNATVAVETRVQGIPTNYATDSPRHPPPSRFSSPNRPPVSFSDRRRVYGENRLPRAKTPSFWALMWHAFNDKLMFLLAASAAVSLALGISQIVLLGKGNTGAKTGWAESATIAGAILVTVIATAANDYQKNYKFQKLNQRREERMVTAVRSGKSCQISVFDIVVGDLLRVGPGDVLAADGLLVEAFSMRCDESHLSGELEAVHKVPACRTSRESPGEFVDSFLYSGAVVSQGVGTYIVMAVGINSAAGRIAMSLRNEIEVTPLQQRLAHLAKYIIMLGSIVGLLYFIALFVRFLVDIFNSEHLATPHEKGKAFLNIFMLAVTVVIIGVPEGLSLAVALALAFGTTRMLSDNILVRLLRSCEVMGSATTICTDKTGTLTCNKMTVVSGLVGHDEKFGPCNNRPGASCNADESDADSMGKFLTATELARDLAHDVRTLVKASIALNSTAIEQEGNFIGSSTESALLKFAREHLAMGPLAEERANFHVVELFPFSADRKYMAVIIKLRDRYRILVKGAAEIVVDNCIGTLENTKKHFNPREELIVVDLDENKRAELEETTRDYAHQLLRPVAMAYRDLESWPPIAVLGACDDPNDIFANFEHLFRQQMTFIAMFAIRDPLRREAISSIRQCQRAGVFVRMLTGDNLATAEATAMECGIYTPGGVAMDGPTFRRLTVKQVDAILPRLQVLARSSADDKAILVMALKRLGETVAVTGDGTNDAFALKAADIGFSMGDESGTDVAKKASSIVILDDNFASIVKALSWGRAITESVKKYCQVSCSIELTVVSC